MKGTWMKSTSGLWRVEWTWRCSINLGTQLAYGNKSLTVVKETCFTRWFAEEFPYLNNLLRSFPTAKLPIVAVVSPLQRVNMERFGGSVHPAFSHSLGLINSPLWWITRVSPKTLIAGWRLFRPESFPTESPREWISLANVRQFWGGLRSSSIKDQQRATTEKPGLT